MKPKSSAAQLGPLVEQVRELVQSARRTAAAAVNSLQVLTNFEIGRLIVEHEQKGKTRADYGLETLKALANQLTGDLGRGFSERNLKSMRKFYLLWKDRVTPISQKVSAKLPPSPIGQTLSAQLGAISEKPSRKLPGKRKGAKSQSKSGEIGQTVSAQSQLSFALSWSHYVTLMTIENPDERSFYEIESAASGWSVRELERQLNSGFYERLALSRDKKGIRKLAEEGHQITRPEDLLREPLVLEFLGLDERAAYTETDLESALIDKLQGFLLELGKGFLFEARQKRFTFDGDHYHVDLVLYNRLLRCYVLIDLKLDKLGHQDLGQMQMYVNHYDRHVRVEGENPTVGILLCKRKRDALVELTLPSDANIFASRYQLYLPTREELSRRLMEWGAG